MKKKETPMDYIENLYPHGVKRWTDCTALLEDSFKTCEIVLPKEQAEELGILLNTRSSSSYFWIR